LPLKAVIFDCDGVLVDSVGLVAEVLADYLADLGFEVTSQEARRRFGSGKMADYVARFEQEMDAKLPVHFEQELRRRRDVAFRERLKPMAGALELVESLHVPSCVASNGPVAQIELSLKIVGLYRMFAGRIFSAYTVRAWKPEPGLFLHAGRELGAEPHECAVIEDSELGIQAGLAAGMRVFALLPKGQEARQTGVTTLRRLSELPPHLATA
jgi:HAD superfamily hydrolase (TIGR01509 family)